MKELTTGSIISHYTVKGRLGEGGTGVVYHAVDNRLLRPVALKLLTPGQLDDEQSRRRFMQEARAASSLNHPNIVTIYDIGEAKGVDFIAMEFLAGKTLTAHIESNPLPLGRAVRYGAQIADALTAAHHAGIVHRDIKPANVIITDRDNVKLLDFGLAKLDGPLPEEDEDKTKLAGPQTVAGVMMGTLAYMSPEQAQSQPVGPPTDVFSFGVMLYEMLCGDKPFQGASQLARLAAMLKTEAVPIRQKAPGVPPELERLVSACLQKDAALRPPMGDVLAQLRELDLQTQMGTINRTVIPGQEFPVGQEPTPTMAAAGISRTWKLGGVVALTSVAAIGAWFAPRWMKPAVQPKREHVLMRLTFDSGFTGVPALSSDGKFVAYSSDRGEAGNLDIWLQQIEKGSTPVHVTSDEADETEPCFSPDGSKIVFRSEREGGGIYIVPAFGGQPKLLARGGRRPRFSPDGKWIAFWQGQMGSGFTPGSGKVKIIPSDGGVEKILQPEFAVAAYPVWTPDGSSILFLGKKSNERSELPDWWVTKLEGGEAGRTAVLDSLRAKKMSPAPGYYGIAPEMFLGNRVLFAAKVADGVNVWDVALPTAGDKTVEAPERRTSGTNFEIQPASAANGTMAFSSSTVTTGIWRLPLRRGGVADGEPVKLTKGVNFDAFPSLSEDGKKLVFLSERSGRRNIWFRDMISGKETQLTPGSNIEEQPKISGDGKTIAYLEVHKDVRRLFVLTATEDGKFGTSEPICDNCGIPNDLTMDGKLILLESGGPPHSPLWMDWRARKTHQLVDWGAKRGFAYAPTLSNDGKWVAFHTSDGRSEVRQIHIIPVLSEDKRVEMKDWIPVTAGKTLDREAIWSPDDSAIYFLSERDGFRCIWEQLLDPATKRPRGEARNVVHFHRAYRSISNVPGSVAAIGLTLQPNQLVFSLGEIAGNVWMQQDEIR